MNPATERRLGELADRIEAGQVELEKLFGQRADIWAAAMAAGATAVDVAAASRVKATTVRQWNHVRRDTT